MLLDTLIFQKTEIARAEIAGRTLGLSNELRLVLVLIDGRRDVAALALLSPRVAASHDCLEQLLALDAIEVIGESQPGDARTLGFDTRPELRLDMRIDTRPDTRPEFAAEPLLSRELPRAATTQVAPAPAIASATHGAGNESLNTAAAIDAAAMYAPLKPNNRLLQARAQLGGELARLLGADAKLACERVQQMNTREELLAALPKLTNLIALYGHTQDAQRIRTDITYLLAMA